MSYKPVVVMSVHGSELDSEHFEKMHVELKASENSTLDSSSSSSGEDRRIADWFYFTNFNDYVTVTAVLMSFVVSGKEYQGVC